MTNPLYLKVPHEIVDGAPRRLLEPDFLAVLKQRALDWQYFSEPGSAEEFLRILEEKIAQLPRDQIASDIADRIQEITVILKSWTLPLYSLEDIREFFKNETVFFLRNETMSSGTLLSRVAFAHSGMADLFLRWTDAVVDGLRSCQGLIGTQPITIFTGRTVPPTVENWLADFERYATNHSSGSSIVIAEYLTKSPNVKTLAGDETEQVRSLFQWFSIFRFREIPVGISGSEGKIPATTVSSSQVQAAPAVSSRASADSLPPVSGAPSRTIQPSVIKASSNRPVSGPLSEAPVKAMPPASLAVEPDNGSPETRIRQSLAQNRALLNTFEQAERELPLLNQGSMSQLTVLTGEALKGGETVRAIAGLFQFVRANGLVPLMSDQGFIRLMRETVGPYLQTTYHLTPAVALRAIDLPPNRISISKEFLKILLTKASGDESNAARIMVYLANLVPKDRSGPEATFAYYDLPNNRYAWSSTAVSEDGTLRNEII